MEIRTHKLARQTLVGSPIRIIDDVEAEVELRAVEEMAVDEQGLIHGGFTFGLADYAAMLAVNHPFVVLGASQVRFTAPVRVGDLMRARAKVVSKEGWRREVAVEVFVEDKRVLTGTMTCYVLDRHVLEK
ncbi:PaaI family thioesterase [Candidatus Bathyarchaeota archaeon]|nr:PaaI family thioesterase [Candidatus Bathyarchaeota archaeon]